MTSISTTTTIGINNFPTQNETNISLDKDRDLLTIYIEKSLTIRVLLKELFIISPVIAVIELLLTTWATVNLILFVSGKDYIFHPFLNLFLFLSGVGLFVTMFITAYDLIRSRFRIRSSSLCEKDYITENIS